MLAPPVYLDECVDGRLAASLRQQGFTVTSTFDQQMTGADHETQLQFATQHGWAILSVE